MTMALQVFTDVMALIWQYPVFSCLLLLVFTPPFFPIVKFFSPLLISTALFMLALFTMNPQTESLEGDHQESWEFRRVADVKVWEDKSVGEYKGLRSMADGNWMDRLRTIQEAGLTWIEAKFRNENWKGSSLNDDNVSILQEASWPSTSEEVLEVDTKLTTDVIAAVGDVGSKLTRFSISEVIEEPVVKPQHVHHEPLVIPKRGATVTIIDESPSTDLDESTDLVRRLVRRDSVKASSGLSESDVDTPTTVVTLSKSGKLKQIETLGELIEEKELAEKTGEEVPAHELAVLKPTTAEEVDAVKEKLEDFTHSSGEIKPVKESKAVKESKGVKGSKTPGSPLFKERSSAFSDDDDSSDVELELSDDSDSDSEFQIFPPVDPKKMKLHPPVKLDIRQLEIKLGTSLTPPKGEITEVQ